MKQAPTILALPPDLIARIAAGEVVERPAFALKELLDNAIDAGSTRIDIDIRNAGLGKIVIHDNGTGMTGEDLELCWLPHTTSKINPEEGLSGVTSLGFRGEALHSIAAISRLTIRSRPIGQTAGQELVIEGGKLLHSAKIGMPTGTTVVVEDLFYTTPVRKKFLKSPQTEFRLMLDVVIDMALAYPAIGFRVGHNGKNIMDLPVDQSLDERIRDIFGADMADELLPVSLQEGTIELNGFISKPVSDAVKYEQYFIVNKRPVLYHLLSSYVKQAYGSLLEPRAMPFIVLHLSVPSHYVDVNVHPRKETIHLLNEQDVGDILLRTVQATLQQNNLTYEAKTYADELRDGGTSTYAAKKLRKETDPWGGEMGRWKLSDDILQLHNLYLVVPTKRGVLLVDQHAAHERILYEQFLNEFIEQQSKREVYVLLKSVTFETSPSEAELIREYLPALQDLGFEVEEFGTSLFKITTVPGLFRDRDPLPLLRELVQDLAEGIGLRDVDSKTHRMLSYLACRTAIKSGAKLSKDQARELIKKLEQCTTQYTCPHGRPVKAEVTIHELEKMFRRR